MRILLALALAAGCDGEKKDCDQWVSAIDDSDEDPADLGCAILSVWGDAWDDLWFAGGSLGVEPRHACGLRFDGHSWTVLPIDSAPSFWWVTTTPESTWFVGEEGTIVRWKGNAQTTYDGGVDATLFGVWGASDDEVWAVGGSTTGDADVILRFDGSTWTRVPPPEAFGSQFFKVWGSAADDVWIVGTGGVVLHYDGSAWATHTIITDVYGGHPSLFTVHGRAADDVWAVGMSSTIVHFDGDSWTPWSNPSGEPLYAGLLNGVYAPVGGDVLVVGPGAVKLWIADDDSLRDETLEGTFTDLHGAWTDAAGHAFAVGGNFVSPAPDARRAAVDFHGCEISRLGLP
jgi:hypothetical protein